MNDPEKESSRWVKHLHGLVDKLNDTTTEMTEMKPKDAYLLQPGEEHDDKWCRAMDRVWSKGTYRLKEIIEDSGSRVMYYLSDGPERAFVSEELMLIPEDTELPPDYVPAW